MPIYPTEGPDLGRTPITVVQRNAGGYPTTIEHRSDCDQDCPCSCWRALAPPPPPPPPIACALPFVEPPQRVTLRPGEHDAWVKNGIFHWQAQCRCGWRSDVTGVESFADRDARAHNRFYNENAKTECPNCGARMTGRVCKSCGLERVDA